MVQFDSEAEGEGVDRDGVGDNIAHFLKLWRHVDQWKRVQRQARSDLQMCKEGVDITGLVYV